MKHFYFFRQWFVFPLSLTYHGRSEECRQPGRRIELHFLWWHWKWDINTRE